MDILGYNKSAWDAAVDHGNKWTVPVSQEEVAAARQGNWQVLLTPQIPVPKAWFPELNGCDVLGLASGGGQQCPIFAAAGARVTVFDNSPGQLRRDREVAQREGFEMRFEQGDMADLSRFAAGSFDLVFNPCSNCFAPDVKPIWRECARVLRSGGVLMAGFGNPLIYIFDPILMDRGELAVKYRIPHSDVTDLDEATRQHYINGNEPLIFGHSLDDQLGAQLRAGFKLTDMFEDRDETNPLSKHIANYIATRAVRSPTA